MRVSSGSRLNNIGSSNISYKLYIMFDSEVEYGSKAIFMENHSLSGPVTICGIINVLKVKEAKRKSSGSKYLSSFFHDEFQ